MSGFIPKFKWRTAYRSGCFSWTGWGWTRTMGLRLSILQWILFRYYFVKCLSPNWRAYIDPPLEVPEYIQFVIQSEHLQVHVCVPGLEGEQKAPRGSHGTTSATCVHDHCPFSITSCARKVLTSVDSQMMLLPRLRWGQINCQEPTTLTSCPIPKALPLSSVDKVPNALRPDWIEYISIWVTLILSHSILALSHWLPAALCRIHNCSVVVGSSLILLPLAY